MLDFATVYTVAFFVVNSGKKRCEINRIRFKGKGQLFNSLTYFNGAGNISRAVEEIGFTAGEHFG
ncbi:hypothetical protein GDQ93_15995 [Escherichia coli]|nr:hypothetical protein [Escherichia coli]MLN76460.1 hypothetical protein [Escherichia coli]